MYDSKQRGERFDHREYNPHVDILINYIRKKEWDELKGFYHSLSSSERHHTVFCAAYFLSPDDILDIENSEETEFLVIIGGAKNVLGI